MEPSGVNRAHACTRTSYSTALQAKRPPTKAREPGSVRLEPRKTGSNEGKPAAQTVRVSFLNKKKNCACLVARLAAAQPPTI